MCSLAFLKTFSGCSVNWYDETNLSRWQHENHPLSTTICFVKWTFIFCCWKTCVHPVVNVSPVYRASPHTAIVSKSYIIPSHTHGRFFQSQMLVSLRRFNVFAQARSAKSKKKKEGWLSDVMWVRSRHLSPCRHKPLARSWHNPELIVSGDGLAMLQGRSAQKHRDLAVPSA